jgi:hypothetical protein
MRKEVRTVMILPSPNDLVRDNDERVSQLRRELYPEHASVQRRPLRRWVGRQMVRIGVRLAADPSLKPARSH